MIKVQLPNDLLEQTNQFCRDVKKARINRNIRNNDERPGRLVDETIGKIGEVAVAYHYNKLNLVDWNIYPNGKTSFSPDLGIVHVKTCNWDHRGGMYDSWTVDKEDPVYLKPNSKEDIILTYSQLTGSVHLYGRILAAQALPHWKNCIHDFLKHKQAIYRNDISNLVEEFN